MKSWLSHCIRPALAALALAALATLPIQAEEPPPPGPCQTTIFGGTVSGTWTPAASPYCVKGSINVAGLTIQPGTVVVLDPSVQVNVLGGFVAVGTPSSPILFTAADRDSRWLGISFQSVAASQLEHCQIEYAGDAGLRFVDSTPTIAHCVVSKCESTGIGGGVQVTFTTDTSWTLSDVTIIDNSSSTHGGGLSVNLQGGTLTLDECKISRNAAHPGSQPGAPSCATIPNGTFYGGGVYALMNGGELALDNCVISHNLTNSKCSNTCCSITTRGGGMYCSGGDVTITKSLVRENRARAWDCASGGCEDNFGYGGGIWFSGASQVLTCVNTIFAGNSSFFSGSDPRGQGNAIYLNNGTAVVDNCTIARNGAKVLQVTEGLRNNAGTLTVHNSIAYWNSPHLAGTYGAQVLGAATIDYSDVQGGASGTGNLDVAPVFVGSGTTYRDLAVFPFSATVDSGDPLSAPDACFLPSQGTAAPDMGAFGSAGACGFTLEFEGSSSSVSHNGSGANPDVYVETCAAVLGRTWAAEIELPIGGLASFVAFLGGGRATTPIPLALGELLCFPPVIRIDSGLGIHTQAIPNDLSLFGKTLCTQGATLSPGPTVVLTNAIDITIGSY